MEFLQLVVFIIFAFQCTIGIENPQQDVDAYLKDLYPELYSNKFEGDILIPEGYETRNAIRDEKYRWPKGNVPYEISSNYTLEDKEKILRAMTRLETEITCIKFYPRVNEDHYIQIEAKEKAGCFAVIGYHSDYPLPHPVNLETPGCLRQQGTIEHELLHVLGLYHEQSRYDRDDYVTIYYGNITEKYYSDFKKTTKEETTTYDIPYNIKSVMHYPRFAFSKNGLETIVYTKDPNAELGQRKGALEGDLEKVRKMYKCGKKENCKPSDWLIDQFQNVLNNGVKKC